MFSKIHRILRELTDYYTILMIIAIGIFTLLIDGKRYRQKGYMRELRMVKIISYSYITIGGLLYVLLLLI
ncbi:CLC_0170 family protein [Tissierella sp.]|uniref:CLC_0170 family protein n=1 Tax=Tissierella sp. TaxID=41274 RepID=UPI0028A72853|nr:CLC_0170 family protein [Tissierella sp.]